MGYMNGDILLEIVKGIMQVDAAPCKKKLQKMVYLIEEKGNNLGFGYKLHLYGPYSEDLDYEVSKLFSEGRLNIQYTSSGHNISCDVSRVNDLKDENIINIIKEFGRKSANDLELLTTTLYAERNIEMPTRDRLIGAVKKVKGDKYSDDKIVDAIGILNTTGYMKLVGEVYQPVIA